MSTSAQLEVLRPFVNDRVSSLVRGRLLDGLKFFRDGVLLPEYGRSEVKLALLLVQIANERENFTADELHVLGGRQKISSSANTKVSSATVSERQPTKNRKNGR